MPADDPFGKSLQLTDGDIVFERDPITGQRILAPVEGKANLVQALVLRVLTAYGSDMFNTTYGLDVREAFVQGNGVRMVKELIRLNLVRTLGTDPRVHQVTEVLFEDDPQYAARHPDLPTGSDAFRRNRLWHVDVTIEAVNGTTETLATTVGV